jgi:Rieske Fe-S protein
MVTAQPSRRSVLSGSVATVVGAVAGFLAARRSGAAKSHPAGAAANAYGAAASGPGRVLLPVGEVPAGGGRILDADGVVVTREVSGTVHAFSTTCTHQGCTVNSVSAGTINCPCHGSRFDLRTGAPVGGPAARPLTAVPVVVRAGQVVEG